MTNELIKEWADNCELRNNLLFLSNENQSWTYSELANALRTFQKEIENMSPSICMIEGDYSLESVAWLIVGLCNGWQMVPIVSPNPNIIQMRQDISNAVYRVSLESNWKISSIKSSNIKSNITPEKTGVILFSSGSTGVAKAMCQDLTPMLNNPKHHKGKPTCMGLLLLFDHIGGLNTLFSGLRKAVHLVAPLARSPTVMAKLIHNHQVKILPCSPTFLNMMYLDGVFEEFDFKSLRLVTYGTERMPEELLTRLSKELPRVKFLQTFGTSETGIVQTKSLSSTSTFLTIDDPNVDWKIENKELWLKSSNQISNYINTDEKAIDDGWFKTGDLVEIRDDNYFRIIGRKKEVINVGGEKVLPSEVEDFIMSLDGVVDCTAFAVTNGITGQAVGIRVIPDKNINEKDLKKHIRSTAKINLENYKVPVKIIFDSKLSHTERFKKDR